MPSMRMQRVDQILASRAFKYLIDEDPVVEHVLKQASVLAGKSERTEEEQKMYEQLCAGLKDLLVTQGQTLAERRLELQADEQLRQKIRQLQAQVFGEQT